MVQQNQLMIKDYAISELSATYHETSHCYQQFWAHAIPHVDSSTKSVLGEHIRQFTCLSESCFGD